jgi:hypothetical protein
MMFVQKLYHRVLNTIRGSTEMNIKLIEFGVIIFIVIGLLFGGWVARGWYEGKQQLAQHELADKVTSAIQQSEASTAKIVEDKLATLSTGEKVIRHETIKVLESPVYNINCIDDAGLQLIELAKRQYSDARKSDDKVPTRNPKPSGESR